MVMIYYSTLESKGIDDKKASYLNSLNKYMRLKYLDKDEPAASVSSMISEVQHLGEMNNQFQLSLLHSREMILKCVKYGRFSSIKLSLMKSV